MCYVFILFYSCFLLRYNSTENGKLPEHYRSLFPRLVVDTGQSLAYHLEDDTNQVFSTNSLENVLGLIFTLYAMAQLKSIIKYF